MTIVVPAQLGLLVYHQITTWCDLFPFNGVRYTKTQERVGEAIVNFVLMSLAPVGFGLGYEPLMKFGFIYYFVLFAVECATWWVPYTFGASAQWQEIYLRVHARTITIIPTRAGKPAPNLEHMILMVLTAAVAVITGSEFTAHHSNPLSSLWIGWAIGALVTVGTACQMVFGLPASKARVKKE